MLIWLSMALNQLIGNRLDGKYMKVDVEERAARARKAFEEGYNCSQSVVLAYADVTGLDTETLLSLVEPLGGGMGRLREVCGAVSGMFMISGMVRKGKPNNDRAVRTEVYKGVQLLADQYRRKCGSIVCRELLGLKQHSDAPVPEERTAEYYRRRPCAEYIAIAARLAGEYLNSCAEKPSDQ